MRSMGKFSVELHFPSGFQLSTVFTEDECRILDAYGLTMQGLEDGTLMPTSATEHYFLAELDGEFAVTSNLAKCWRKYSKKVVRSALQSAICRKSKRSSSVIIDDPTDDEELALDIDDDNEFDS